MAKPLHRSEARVDFTLRETISVFVYKSLYCYANYFLATTNLKSTLTSRPYRGLVTICTTVKTRARCKRTRWAGEGGLEGREGESFHHISTLSAAQDWTHEPKPFHPGSSQASGVHADHVIDVTVPVQCQVKESRLILTEANKVWYWAKNYNRLQQWVHGENRLELTLSLPSSKRTFSGPFQEKMYISGSENW